MSPKPLPIPAAKRDATTTALLDVALQLLTTMGIRKTTIEDIARHAGVDRVTVHRRIGSKSEVVSAVLEREAQQVFERAAASADGAADVEERVAVVFTGLVRDLRGNALFNKLLALEPDSTLAKVSTDAADLLRLAVQFATTTLLDDVGTDDQIDLETRVEIIVRLIHSLFLTPDAVVTLKTRAQIMAFARRYVAPIVTA